MAHGTDTLRTHSKNRLTYTREQVKFVTFAHKRADSLSSLKWAFTVVSVEGVREQKKNTQTLHEEGKSRQTGSFRSSANDKSAGRRADRGRAQSFLNFSVFWPHRPTVTDTKQLPNYTPNHRRARSAHLLP